MLADKDISNTTSHVQSKTVSFNIVHHLPTWNLYAPVVVRRCASPRRVTILIWPEDTCTDIQTEASTGLRYHDVLESTWHLMGAIFFSKVFFCPRPSSLSNAAILAVSGMYSNVTNGNGILQPRIFFAQLLLKPRAPRSGATSRLLRASKVESPPNCGVV